VADFNNDGYDDLLLSGNWVGRSNTIVYGAANGLDGNTINELPTGPFGQDGFVALKERAWNKIISSHETNSIAFDFNHDGKEDVFSTAINITHYPPGTMNDAMSPRYAEILANGGNDHTESAYQTLLNLDGKNFKSTIPENSNLGYKFYFNQQQYDINQDGNLDVIAYYHTVPRVTDPGGQLFGTTFFINDGSGAFSLIDGADLFPDLTVAPYLNSDTAGIQYSISSPFLLKAAGSVASNKAEVISGEKSIKGEHSGLDAYTPYLITDSSRLPLTAGGSYKITFKYKIISNAGDGFECVIYSPTAGRKGDWLPSIRIKGSAGDTGEAILINTLGAYTDYQVRWNIVGKGSIIIDDIKIEVHSSGALVASETAEDATVNPYTWVNVGAIIPVSDNGKQFTGLQLYPSWLGGEYVVKKFTAGSLSELMPSPIVIRDRQASKSILTQSLNDEIFEFGAVKELTLIDGGAGIDTCVYSENSARYKFSINILGNFNVESDAISDQLKNIERLRFSDKFIAIDINGNAGTTAKILGAVFGKDSVQNKQYVGIGLDLLDKGMDYSTLAGLAVHAAGLTTNDQIVSTLWKNVVGTTASASDKAPFIDLLEHGMTVGDLARLAAETSLNGININLVGLASTGIEYTPVA
jgi:hypothetical protein